MSWVGPLLFCTDCGNLLPRPTGKESNIFECDVCGVENKEGRTPVVRTQSKPSDFPSDLRRKLSNVQTVERHKVSTEEIIAVPCPECDRPKVRYTNVQLKSADEGSTIFYSCECGHRWSENN